MRLLSLLACSSALATLSLSSAFAAPTDVNVFVGQGPTTQASYDIVTDAGCVQRLTFSVNSARFLSVDTATRTVTNDVFEPTLQVIVDQLESPGCDLVTLSTLVDLTDDQFTSNGLGSATLTVDDIFLSDPVLGTIVLDANLQWTGTGGATTIPVQERFCDESGTCLLTSGSYVRRSANVTGTVTATVTPTFGPTYTDDYSPATGTNVTATLERSSSVVVAKYPAP